MSLQREAGPPPTALVWLRAHPAGVACCAIGIAAIAAGCWMQFGGSRAITDTPDVRITVPLLVLALGSGIYSLARKEGAPVLPIVGIALAAAAVVLGYVVLVVIVAAAAGFLIALISQVT